MSGECGLVERRLLLACARRRAQTIRPEWTDTSAHIDWASLVGTAIDHGVAELLWAPLRATGCEAPPAILADLERRVLEATGQGLRRTSELANVIRLLNERGIRALTFKGPVLAADVYGHIGCRLSSDLDLFVDRRDYRRASAVLLAAGYQRLPSGARPSRWLPDGLLPVEGRYEEFVPADPSQSMIDLHVGFADWRYGIRLDSASLFDRSTNVEVAGYRLPTPHPHDLLLVLAIHGMSHQWKPLRLVTDIDAVVEHVTDWSDVVERAQGAGMRRVLWVALLLAERLLGTVLPPDVRRCAHADGVAQSLVSGVTARLFTLTSEPLPDGRGWAKSFLDEPHRRAAFVARRIISGWLTWRQRPTTADRRR